MPDNYADNPEFREFLNREFDETAIHASMEELAEFAFGGFEEAVKAFKEQKS
ncbi:MAG: hypothetical protein ACYSSP_02895 [Planctomycetota bacterium]